MLCDFETGGETVTSIAVEDASPNAIFWITVNNKGSGSTTSYRAASHLASTIQALKDIAKSSAKIEQRETKIFLDSVKLCQKKVKNYRRKVQILLKIWKKKVPAPPDDGKSLFDFNHLV